MLSCKQVAAIASDYLDNSSPLKWQIRLHLLMCANCRRFVRHLKTTQQVGEKITLNGSAEDAEVAWQNLQAQIKREARSTGEQK